MPTPEPADFDRAVSFLLKQEGGWTTDTGGATRFGISQKAYPDIDLSKLTTEGAKEIYRRDYWDRLGLGELPHTVALVMLEASVNLGHKAAVKCLQRSINRLSGSQRLKVDGDLGPITRRAVLAQPGKLLAMLVAIGRLEIHYRLAAAPKYAPYIRGWAGRCVRLCNQLALDWAESNKEG
jgi:lysozyme family protein